MQVILSGNNKTSPNDASCVVWALSEHFLFFSWFFLILTKVLMYLQVLITKCTSDEAGTMGTGSNDVRRVVWALGELLFLFFFNTN